MRSFVVAAIVMADVALFAHAFASKVLRPLAIDAAATVRLLIDATFVCLVSVLGSCNEVRPASVREARANHDELALVGVG